MQNINDVVLQNERNRAHAHSNKLSREQTSEVMRMRAPIVAVIAGAVFAEGERAMEGALCLFVTSLLSLALTRAAAESQEDLLPLLAWSNRYATILRSESDLRDLKKFFFVSLNLK